MPQIITNNFRIYNATKFTDSVDSEEKLYFFIGKPRSWDNETSPPTPVNNSYYDLDYLAENIALKKINSSDVSAAIKRHDWSAGTVYTQYDNTDGNLFNKNFYVLTFPEYNVYKCLYNNEGSASTVKPSGRSSNIFTTSDGYKWKFMYALTDTDILKFLTNEFMAVHTDSEVSYTSIPGTIDSFVIENRGNGYTIVSTLDIAGNGIGAIKGDISISSVFGTINKIEVLDSGRNYTYAIATPNRVFGTTASNAVIRPVISPLQGHGYNSIEELGGHYVMINTRLDYAEGGGDFPVINDYRRIGIVQNPISNYTLDTARETTLDATYKLTLANVSGVFLLDEIMTGTYANGLVITSNTVISPGNTIIRYVNPLDQQLTYTNGFYLGEQLTGTVSGATGIVSNITSPEVSINSGKVLYVENRKAISRNPDQAENIHVVIEF
jgi:hypothetical protein